MSKNFLNFVTPFSPLYHVLYNWLLNHFGDTESLHTFIESQVIVMDVINV